MEIVATSVVLAVIVALISGGVSWRLRANRAAKSAARDDTRRAGVDPTATPEDAALRAQGKSAWMRPSGM